MKAIPKDISNKLANVSFVCACLVVFIHVGVSPIQGSWQWWLASLGGVTRVAVPLFFVVSGYLFAGRIEENRWWGRQVRVRGRTILIPYFLWNLAYFLFWVAITFFAKLGGRTFGGLQNNSQTIFGLRDVWGVIPWHLPELELLWFLRALIVLVVFSPLIVKLLQSRFAAVFLLSIFLMLGTLCFWVPLTGNSMFVASGWGRAIVYFTLGLWLRMMQIDMNVGRIYGWGSLIVGGVLSCASVGLGLTDGSGAYLLGWAATPFLAIGLWVIVPAAKWSVQLTGTAFAIYLLHAFIGNSISMTLSFLEWKDAVNQAIWFFFVKGGVMIMGSIAVAILLSVCPLNH